MRSISVSEAKAGFAALLRRVRQGETVLITVRGKARAKLMPEPVADAASTVERGARPLRGAIRRGRNPSTG